MLSTPDAPVSSDLFVWEALYGLGYFLLRDTPPGPSGCEKAGIWIPKSYNEAVNDPIHGSKWKEAIHKELSTLIALAHGN